MHMKESKTLSTFHQQTLIQGFSSFLMPRNNPSVQFIYFRNLDRI